MKREKSNQKEKRKRKKGWMWLGTMLSFASKLSFPRLLSTTFRENDEKGYRQLITIHFSVYIRNEMLKIEWRIKFSRLTFFLGSFQHETAKRHVKHCEFWRDWMMKCWIHATLTQRKDSKKKEKRPKRSLLFSRLFFHGSSSFVWQIVCLATKHQDITNNMIRQHVN